MNPQTLAEAGWDVIADKAGNWVAQRADSPMIIHGSPDGKVTYHLPKAPAAITVKGFGRNLIVA